MTFPNLSHAPNIIDAPTLLASRTAHRYAERSGQIMCMICRDYQTDVDHLTGPGGFWICNQCCDHRERARRGKTAGDFKAGQTAPACTGYPMDLRDPARGRCACGTWVHSAGRARHEASEIHRFLLPIALSVPGRVLVTGQTAATLALALGGHNGQIGREIHPALARWFPIGPDSYLWNKSRYNNTGVRGVLAISESVWATIRNTIESVPLSTTCGTISNSWATAFLVAYDVQMAYSKAPLAMWQTLMDPAPDPSRSNWERERIGEVREDLQMRLGSEILSHAREVVWARHFKVEG